MIRLSLALLTLLIGAGLAQAQINPWYNGDGGGRYIFKFGRNSDIDTTTDPEDVYECPDLGGPEFYQFGTGPETLFVSSSNAGDALEVTVQGLDENGLDQIVEVTLAGQTFTQVGDALGWTRVNRAFNSSATELVGNVFIHVDPTDGDADGLPDTDAQWRSCFKPFLNQTTQAIYTVPHGQVGYLMQLCLGINATTGATTEVADMHLQVRKPGGVFRTQHIMGISSVGAGVECFDFAHPRRIEPLSDMRVRVISVASNDTDVFATFELRMRQDL